LAAAALGENIRRLLVGGTAFGGLWSYLIWQWPGDAWSSGVAVWWTVLCVVSVANLYVWHRSAMLLAREQAPDPSFYAMQRWQLILSAVFVIGCGFRSFFPRADVQRLGLIDSWLSSVLVGRSVATAAEMCFMTQWALVLRTLSRTSKSNLGIAASWILVPLIGIAETASWYSVLSTSYLGNVIEESIWALSALMLVIGCLLVWPRTRGARRLFLGGALVLGIAYVVFMTTVDVPMYVSRWLADEAAGREYLSLLQGVEDAWSRRIVSLSWEEWRPEIPWMTLYFSVCVWWSLALIHEPRPEANSPLFLQDFSCDGRSNCYNLGSSLHA
jgi:hypothetical protein